MKKHISFGILLLLLLPLSVYPQWVSQTLPGGIRVTLGIDFINQNHGITGGWSGDFTTQINGKAYYTTNGGTNWIQASIPDSMRVLVNAVMINDNLIYGAGAYNLPVATSSEEGNPESKTQLSSLLITRYEKLGVNPARQEDYRGYFVESTNGGATWHPKGTFEDSVYYLIGISFINDQTGFVVATSPGASSNAILKTTDGGNSWYYVYLFEQDLIIEDIGFVNELNGIAVGESGISPPTGIILLTSDGGETWSKSYLNQMSYIYNVAYNDQYNLILGGVNSIQSGAVYKSSDGGYTWEEIHSYSVSYSPGVFNALFNSDYILAAGTYIDNNMLFVDISTDRGNIWNNFVLSPLTSHIPTFSKMVDEQRWYITGTKNNATAGFIVFTDNSGGVPVEITSFTAENVRDRVILKWTTATETNNEGFIIERSQELGVGIQKQWIIIGNVEGNGTTTKSHSYSFADKNVRPGKYQYRLKQIDFDGSYEYSNIVETEVNEPEEFLLAQNYPNPFNPVTSINYSIPEKSFVSLKVYDVLGKEIITLVNEIKQPGIYTADFHAADLSSGVYIYKLECEKYYSMKKMMLIR